MASKARKPMYKKMRKELPKLIRGNSLSLGGDTPLSDLFENLKVTDVDIDDAQSLSYEDNSWDNIVSDQMLEHLPRPWDAVNEMFRVCKPGGYVICTTCSWNPVHRCPKDYYRFMPDGMEYLFNKFEDVKIGSIGSRDAIMQDLKYSPLGDKTGVQDIKYRNKISNDAFDENEDNFPWHIWVIAKKPSPVKRSKKKIDPMLYGICLFHKDENEFLDEWIDHHFSLGFDIIHIYDNESKVLPEERKNVKVTAWKDSAKGKHARAYNHFVKKYKHSIDWCLFIDTDEYLHLVNHKNVKNFLKDYSDYDSIYLNRLNYGSSFKKRISSHKELTRHGPLDFSHNFYGKSLVYLPAIESEVKDVHNIDFDLSVNTSVQRVRQSRAESVLFDVAYIKHYYTRGTEQLEEKLLRGPGQNSKDSKHDKRYNNWEEYTNWLRDVDRKYLNLYEEGDLLPK